MSYSRPVMKLWTGILTTAAVALYQSIALALSPQEVQQVAQSISVQVNPSPTDAQQRSGTGIIISKQGNRYTVLTCYHVLKDQPASIRTHDGRSYSIVDRQGLAQGSIDEQNGIYNPDLALLTFESTASYPTAKLGNSDQAIQGSAIFVYGFPVDQVRRLAGENRQPVFTQGFVIDRLSQETKGYTMRYNAPTGGGMSGGPVLDIDGRVIGVHGQGIKDPVGAQTQGGSYGDPLAVSVRGGNNAAVPVKSFLSLQSQLQLTVDNQPSSDRPTARLQNPESALAFAARAQILKAQGDRTAALADYEQAIRLDSNNAYFFYERANLRYDQGDKQGALQDYTQAIMLDPTLVNAYFNRGVVRNGLGDKLGAVQDFTAAIQFSPYDVQAYYSRGVVLRSLRDAQNTFADFDTVVRLAPNRFEGYYNRALAWAMLGNRPNAIADLTQTLTLNPRYTQAAINRALTRRRLGDREGAVADLSYVLSYEPNNATATYNRGLFRRDLGDQQGAYEDLQRAATLFQQAGDQTNYRKAIEVLQRLQSTPTTPLPTDSLEDNEWIGPI